MQDVAINICHNCVSNAPSTFCVAYVHLRRVVAHIQDENVFAPIRTAHMHFPVVSTHIVHNLLLP